MSCRLRRVPTQAPLAPNDLRKATCESSFGSGRGGRSAVPKGRAETPGRSWSGRVDSHVPTWNRRLIMLPYFFFATDTPETTLVHVASGLKESIALANSPVLSPRSF